MSSDIVKRLLERGGYFPTIEREAADRIEALEAEVTKARGIAAELNSGWAESEEISRKNYAAWKEAEARAERLRVALEDIKRLSRHRLTDKCDAINQRACKALEEEDKE